MIRYFIVFYFAENIITFTLYGIDKNKARKEKWRIRESTLILCGLLFGAIGQILGMRIFHHKTKKWYFVLSAITGLALQAVLFYFLINRLGFTFFITNF